jgi:hypothetical protein
MVKHEMTEERKKSILTMIQWYWGVVIPTANITGIQLISKSDYEFLYQLYDNSLSFYDKDIQTRLNNIKDIYNSKEWKKQMKSGSHDWWKAINETNQI